MSNSLADQNIGHNTHQQTVRLVSVAFLARFTTDTLTQMFYAFLPILAQGIGVTPVVFGRLLTVRSSAGLLTPVFGNLVERRGYRVALPAILLCGTLGALLLVLTKSLWIIVPAIFIMGIGVTTFQPLLAGYASQALPAAQRARGMGIIEYAWAVSSIIGVYAVGQVLKVSGWQVPLIVIAGTMAAVAVLFFLLLRNQPDADASPPISLREQFTITENRTGAYAAIAMQSVIVFAGLHLFISYSIWLVAEYDFGAVALGSVVLAFGFVDLAGSGLVSLILDRLGRQRPLIISSGLTGITFLLLGAANEISLPVVMGVLIFGRFLFEFTIVSCLITVSEQSPNQRSRVMSLMGFVTTISQALAGLTGPVAVSMWGINGLGVPTGIGFLVAAGLAWLFIKE